MAISISERAARAKARLIKDLLAEGFDAARIVAPDAIATAAGRLNTFIEQGRHGDMAWMVQTQTRRASPQNLWPQVRSIIMVSMNYGPEDSQVSLKNLAAKDRATLSVYAQNRDYHDLMKGKLKQAAGRFAAANNVQVKVFVDTAPVMEKPLAHAAGLGWQGKHTNLVSRTHGSWFFLAALFTDMELPVDTPEVDHCGSCHACLDICPTNAFPAPYQLDARKCISYLTIEHSGPIASRYRKAMGNRIYGCDDCLAVCPWNKFAAEASQAKLQARDELRSPELETLLALDDPSFRALFSGSPIKRIGVNRFLRNCLIAAGNSGLAALVNPVKAHLDNRDPTVRGAAVWALSQLIDAQAFDAAAQAALASEKEPCVRAEWTQAVDDKG